MASLYKQKKSGFWWIKFRDPVNGHLIRQSTGFRFNNSIETRRARELEAEKTLAERATNRSHRSEAWDVWVKPFLNSHYAMDAGSRIRYLTAWRSLRLYLEEGKVFLPRNLTREHCTHYIEWRKTPNYKQGKYRAGHNTALLELKTLSLLMEEAVRRGYAADNCARRLGIKRAPRKEFPELTDEAIQLVLQSIPKEPEPLRTFLQNSFLIARWHGVRLTETFLNPQTHVWQQTIKGAPRWVILFHQKGDKTSPKLLHPELVPLLRDLKLSGAVQTYTRPRNPSREWFEFLHRAGVKKLLPNACFHSLRVTAATRLARANVPERKAMEYLSHASTTVHEAYVRWHPEDLEECHGAL